MIAETDYNFLKSYFYKGLISLILISSALAKFDEQERLTLGTLMAKWIPASFLRDRPSVLVGLELFTGLALFSKCCQEGAIFLSGIMSCLFLIYHFAAPELNCNCFGSVVLMPKWSLLLINITCFSCSVILFKKALKKRIK